MAKEKIVNVKENEIEEVKVDMTVEPQEETKKEKALKVAKKIGNTLFKAAKTATCAVGAVVIGAVAVGVAVAKATEGKVENPETEDNIDYTFDEVSTETAEEESIKEEFNI